MSADRIHAGQVAGVRIAVRIAVPHVEEKTKSSRCLSSPISVVLPFAGRVLAEEVLALVVVADGEIALLDQRQVWWDLRNAVHDLAD